MIIAVIVLGAMVLVLLALVLRGQKHVPADTNTALLLKEDLRALSQDITKLKDGMQTQISDRLDKSQAMMMGSLQRQSSESNKLITEITRNLTELKESNKRVVDVADELKTLQNVLQNPKQRGGLIDEKDKTQRDIIAKTFKADLKNRIDETAKYIRPSEDTLDYAFMFIPSEAIYYDLLINNVGATGTNSRDLIEYAFVDKKVIIVSPTTLLAYLQTVMQGLKSLQIEEQAKDIQKRVGELGKHIAAHETFMQKLGNSLGTSIGHYNSAHKSLKAMDKDVIKIADTAPSVEPLLLDRPQNGDE
jgi:DNA recombination protein RmuC